MATDKAGSGGAGAAAALKSASKAASYNAVLQITFRVATFVMNAVIIRQTSREMLGLVNVRLALLWSTILFIAREALRKTCLGAKVGPEGGDNGWIGLLNLMWLGVPLGIAASLGLSYVWLSVLSAPDDPGYPLAVCAFALSAVLELVVEPLWLLAQSLLYVKLKVLAEGCALGIRCGVTIALLLWRPELGLAAFCVAQLAYAVTLISVYYVGVNPLVGLCCFPCVSAALQMRPSLQRLVSAPSPNHVPVSLSRFGVPVCVVLRAPVFRSLHHRALFLLTLMVCHRAQVYLLREAAAGNLAMIRSWRDFCPRGVGGKPWFLSYPRHLFDLTVNFLQQSLLKQFLTEGERYLMTFANAVSLADQGVYDIITNLGALAARFIFQVSKHFPGTKWFHRNREGWWRGGGAHDRKAIYADRAYDTVAVCTPACSSNPDRGAADRGKLLHAVCVPARKE